MNHSPKKLLRGLAAAALTLGASALIATPALAADEVTCGSLVFKAANGEDISSIVTMSDQTVTVSGGNAQTAITVSQGTSTQGAEDVLNIVIGGEGGSFTGTVTFDHIEENPTTLSSDPRLLSIQIESNGTGGVVTLQGCNIFGAKTGTAAILVTGESDVTLNIEDSQIVGGVGSSDSQLAGGAAIDVDNESTINLEGEVELTGGQGGACTTSTGTPGAGGSGIYGPNATLAMDDGDALIKVGANGTGGNAEPEVLPVAVTVGALNMSNGTGVRGSGPTLAAFGYPTKDASPLPVSGLDAGSSASDTFYPWAVMVSPDVTSTLPSDFVLKDYAGSGNTQPLTRDDTWRWLLIAPNEVTGLGLTALDGDDQSVDFFVPTVGSNPQPVNENIYHFVWQPSFKNPQNLNLLISDKLFTELTPSVNPSAALVTTGSVPGQFTASPEYAGKIVTATCTAPEIPPSLTDLYPNLQPTNSISMPILVPVYRLYNPDNGCHLLTADQNEVNVLTTTTAWMLENEAPSFYMAPKTGGFPVYRLLNPNNGDHLYTTSETEYDDLGKAGWKQEDVAFYGVAESTTGAHAVYRLWNRMQTGDGGLGSHLWTPDEHEYDTLPTNNPVGAWRQEGIAWYAAYYQVATN